VSRAPRYAPPMKRMDLEALLRRVRRGTLAPARAARLIDEAPLERLAFATLDHQRALRVGFPEVIFGQGKSPAQVVAIAGRLFRRSGLVLATRVEEAARAALERASPRPRSTSGRAWWCCGAAGAPRRVAGCWWCAPAPLTCRWPRRRW